MIGRTLSHYRILEKIGSGGMGEVYLAEDTKLARKVAMKILPSKYSEDRELRARFEREARAVAALNHPNIVTIYSVEEAEDSRFFIMEFVPGKTLRELLPESGLPLDEILEVALPVVDALDAAHKAGLVHRDLKPANIMKSSSGRVKILDFGLAKVGPFADETEQTTVAQTRTGVIVGTVPYMSPEQVQGKTVDQRSDIFSFGIVMYELATGRRPFEGDTTADIISSILRDHPKPIVSPDRQLPTQFKLIIERCLEKRADRRYQTAAELGEALRTLASGEIITTTSARQAMLGGLAKTSIAVLPFVNLTGDPEQEFFADGLAEDLINAISRLPGIRVAARTSTFSFKGKDITVREIGERLHVDTVLEGSVRGSGNRLRVNAQLVGVVDGFQLWSERFDRKIDDIFEVQDEIARNIASTLQLQLTGEALVAGRTQSMKAYNAYLHGRFHWNRRDSEGLQKAMGYFQQAIEEDPSYALPYTGLADSFNISAFYNYVAPKEGFPKAKAAAGQALQLDARLAEAHTSLAWARTFFDWDWEKGEQSFKRALTLNPSYATAHLWYCFLHRVRGRTTESRRHMDYALLLDPLSFINNGGSAWLRYHDCDFDAGIEDARRALEIQSTFGPGFAFLGWNLLGKEDYQGALSAWKQAVDQLPGLTLAQAMMGYSLAKTGQRDRAAEILRSLSGETQRYVSSYYVAALCLGLDDEALALDWLERAHEERNNFLVFLGIDPLFQALRSHPRVVALLDRLGLERP
jgi:serine/threonine-protein kinase